MRGHMDKYYFVVYQKYLSVGVDIDNYNATLNEKKYKHNHG